MGRILWLSAPIIIVISLFWMDSNRGGDVLRIFSCSLSASRSPQAEADVLILGSSRSGLAYDPKYMQSILKFEEGLENPSVQRFALTNPDPITTFALVQNRIQNGTPPKVVLLELLLEVREIADAGKDAFESRRFAMLDLRQLRETREDFADFEGDPNFLDWLSIFVNRFTHLLHGLHQHAGQRFWSYSGCTDYEAWSKFGQWSYAEHEAIGDSKTEVAKARDVLVETNEREQDRLNDLEWFQNYSCQDQSDFSYELKSEHRQKEIFGLRRLVDLIEANGGKVIVAPMPSFCSKFSSDDRLELQEILPSVVIFDVAGEAGSQLDAHWRDPHHVTKHGSMLTTAMAAHRIAKELPGD